MSAVAYSSLSRVLDGMEQSLYEGEAAAAMHLDAAGGAPLAPVALTPQADFEAAVTKAKEYILAGDIFQVVLSQRFSAELACDPLLVYRAVRHINPSPYLFYLQMDDTVLVGSSPERLPSPSRST